MIKNNYNFNQARAFDKEYVIDDKIQKRINGLMKFKKIELVKMVIYQGDNIQRSVDYKIFSIKEQLSHYQRKYQNLKNQLKQNSEKSRVMP